MNKFTDIITAVRNLKISLRLSPKEKITAYFFTDDRSLATFLYENRLELKKLINVFHGRISKKDAAKPSESIMAATSFCEIYIPAANLIDLPQEINRLNLQLQKVDEELAKLLTQLNNQQFISRAPVNVVAEVQSKVAEFNSQKSSLSQSLKRLGC